MSYEFVEGRVTPKRCSIRYRREVVLTPCMGPHGFKRRNQGLVSLVVDSREIQFDLEDPRGFYH